MGLAEPVVIYSGRIASEKRIDVLLHAVKLLTPHFPSLSLLITGLGVEHHNLRILAHQLAIEKWVHFTGFVPPDELARYYRASDAFVIMSTADSQSLSLMQAYATGVPAVCARSKGLPDYTPSDCGFLVEPGDHRALAEKLKLLLNDDALRERMGKAAVTFAKTLSPEKIAKEWEEIYRNTIDRNLSLENASVQSGNKIVDAKYDRGGGYQYFHPHKRIFDGREVSAEKISKPYQNRILESGEDRAVLPKNFKLQMNQSCADEKRSR